jgi:hydroxymethylglutaryl-CoA synthase
MSSPENEFGVLATSRYVPHLRLDRSEIFKQHRWMAPGLKSLVKGSRAIANWDEDVVTMAVETARSLLKSLPDARPDQLTLASTTLPFAERINAGIVASALGLAQDTVVRDVTSSARAACTELVAMLKRPAANGASALLLASERRVMRPASAQEMIAGDGAAGVVVGNGAAIATLVASHTVRADFVDHFRQTGETYDYGWEERWVRDEGYMKIAGAAIKDCLTQSGIKPADVNHFVMPASLPRINDAMAKRLGIDPGALTSTHGDTVGDLGGAQGFAMLDTALRAATPGALILLVAFGSGCDVLLLRRTDVPCPGAVPGPGATETSYLKYLSFTSQLPLEWGMRSEMDNKTALTAAWREHERVAHFEGGRCRKCGTVQFPGTRTCVNPDCNAQDSQDPFSLADVPAHALSHTSDFLAYTPHPPFQFGHIDFEGGGRVLMEFTDTAPDELHSGLAVRMVFRIKEFDSKRGFRRYFWKATPVRNPI